MVACMVSGCGSSTDNTVDDSENDKVTFQTYMGTDLVPILEHDYLYYSLNTNTVYYVFRTGFAQSSVSYMAPYIMNGHTCEYHDGEIVEVIPTVRIEDFTN